MHFTKQASLYGFPLRIINDEVALMHRQKHFNRVFPNHFLHAPDHFFPVICRHFRVDGLLNQTCTLYHQHLHEIFRRVNNTKRMSFYRTNFIFFPSLCFSSSSASCHTVLDRRVCAQTYILSENTSSWNKFLPISFHLNLVEFGRNFWKSPVI